MQQQHKSYEQMADALKCACALLDLDPKSELKRDAIAICNHLTNPNFRIAVFGPFNHGKSTLLNAMLGNRALPIDLIPTTGAAITVKYGTDLRTRITLVDGTEIDRSGTEVLKKFAILDDKRRMRNDVASVEVFCPHPFLDTGVEFLDLPGTNDREEQDNLVRQELLGADLVVQLLDARKLMSLGERENLRDWLLDRGIKTVIFVTNFLNLLDPEEQKQVQSRLRFVAESFRAELPPGFSNLYRVDALPALRARLKGDVAAASSSGLAAFETALQNIVAILQQNPQSVRLPRVQPIASQIHQSLKAKIELVKVELQKKDDKNHTKNEIKNRAEQLIKKGFATSVKELRDWLALPRLQNKYQADAAVALAQNKFKTWQRDTFKKDYTELQLAVVKWLYQAYEFFQAELPKDLLIPFPTEPNVTLPPKPGHSDGLSEPSAIAVGSGVGWLLGGPVGAAFVGSITYLVNQSLQKQEEKTANESSHQQVAKICVDAIDDYLSCFSSQGLTILAEYEKEAEKVICFTVSKPLETTKKDEELQRLQNGLNQLNRELEKTLGISIPCEMEAETEIPKAREWGRDVPAERLYGSGGEPNFTVYSFPGNRVKEDVGTSRRQADTVKEDKGEKQVRNFTATNQAPPPPPPSAKDLEAKFQAWEIDEEIAQMKAQMHSSGFQTGKQQNKTQSNKAPNTPKTQTEKDKIARAYTTLGLRLGASQAEVKEAYRTLVKKWHPDLFVDKPKLQKQAEEKMQLINEAYKTITEN